MRRYLVLTAAAISLSGALVVPALSYSRPGTFQDVSVTAAGKPGNADSGWGAASGDRSSMGVAMSPSARYVAFASAATDLVASDSNHLVDVFVRDRLTGKTTIASTPTGGSDPLSLGATGLPNCAGSGHPAISNDGRYVAFDSCALNLIGIGKDTNLADDVFVHDRKTGVTTRVSVASNGDESGLAEPSFAPSMSADGRYVAFESAATNFGTVCPSEIDRSNCSTANRLGTLKTQVFVHDMHTGTTRLVSTSAAGVTANGSSFDPAMSPDGRYVAFVTYANNLVVNDVNISASNPYAVPSSPDVYIKDLKTGVVRLVSVGLNGQAATGAIPESGSRFGGGVSGFIAISANDRYVAFGSNGTDLVPKGIGGGIFVRDLVRNATERVSVSSAGQSWDGTETSGGCGVGHDVVINADGRYVGFVCQPDPTCPDSTPYAAVYDRVTGALDRVSMDVRAPGAPNRCVNSAASAYLVDAVIALSGDGRKVAFATNDPGVIPGLKPTSAPGPYQVVVRDRGPALGGGALWSGAHGASAVGVAYRPATRDIFVRWQLPSMVGVEAVGVAFTANGVRYEVRVSPLGLLSDFALYRSVGSDSWQRVGALTGGYGTTGEEVVVAVPLAALAATSGRQLGDFAALDSVSGGAIKMPTTSALWTGR